MERFIHIAFGLAFATLSAFLPAYAALPTLVTPQLPPAVLGQPYNTKLLVGSSIPLSAVAVSGLPSGMAASTDTLGNITIRGVGQTAGKYSVNINARNAEGASDFAIELVVNRYGNADAVSAGGLHTCAVVDGGVQCWGYNYYGQIGNGKTGGSVWTPVQTIPPNSFATAVSTGEDHTCAIVAGGVKCWGDNYGWQLGNNSVEKSAVPMDAIPPGSGVTAISVEGRTSCAVRAGGVFCWGDVSYYDNGNPELRSATPIEIIPPGSAATGVSTSGGHSCATVAGGVKCWGGNWDGQLGNNSTVQSAVPVQTIPPGSGVTSVSTGNFFSCALQSGGVRCWGGNYQSQLGNGNTTNSLIPIQTIPADSGVVSLAAGSRHACVIVGGDVKCWGDNGWGQVGSYYDVAAPTTPVVVSRAARGALSVSAGYRHTCVVVAAGVQCWGTNDYGQFGDMKDNSFGARPIVTVPAGSNVHNASTGKFNSCAAMGGGLQCWGYGHLSQLGNRVDAPYLAREQFIAADSNVTAVSAGISYNSYACAVVAGGVLCWETFPTGGEVNPPPTYGIVRLQALSAGSGAEAVSAGELHVCVIVSGGVRCWGGNQYGQLGNGTTTDSTSPIEIIASGRGATSISAGQSHTCAVVAGEVMCWGLNTSGQLGTGSALNSAVPVKTVPLGGVATAVAVGDEHTCAIVSGGLVCWGSNSRQLFGNGTNTSSFQPVTVFAANSGVTSISKGTTHTCIVIRGGVQCWGQNAQSQLGNGTAANSLVPVQAIPAGSGVVDVFAGYVATCARVNGGLVCWGANSGGWLGDSRNSYYSDGGFALLLGPSQIGGACRVSI